MGIDTSPAIEAVFTTCPSSSCLSMIGRNTRIAIDDAPQVDAEHPLPVGERSLPRGAAGSRDAGVVADDVHGAEGVERILRQLFDIFRFRDVGTDREHSGAALPHLGIGLIERALFDVREYNLHAFGGEALGEAAADAAGRAGHDCYAVSKFLHAGSLPITDYRQPKTISSAGRT